MSGKGVTLYFVRHGQTYLNLYERMQGWSNAPLTEDGIVDVRRSGKGLKDIKFDAIYTSDLSRTIDTAELILGENDRTNPEKEIQLMPEFREVFFGSFEGEYIDIFYKKVADHLGYESIEEMFRKSSQYEQMAAVKEIDPRGHAEDFMEFWLRAQRGLAELIENHRDSGETILVVAHGMTIRILLENLIPDLNETGIMLNTSVSIAHYQDGMYHLDSYGDTSHFVDHDELD
ncbi:MAG: histidine phosphatase family protein [Atopostipes suicloacalis]|nr:histidine phosphatase family protein [Atopostipes suicloacalis]